MPQNPVLTQTQIDDINAKLFQEAMTRKETFPRVGSKPIDKNESYQLKDGCWRVVVQPSYDPVVTLKYEGFYNKIRSITLKFVDKGWKKGSFLCCNIESNQVDTIQDLQAILHSQGIPTRWSFGEDVGARGAWNGLAIDPIREVNLQCLFDALEQYSGQQIHSGIKDELLRHIYLESIFGKDWIHHLDVSYDLANCYNLVNCIKDNKIDEKDLEAAFRLAKNENELYGLGMRLLQLSKDNPALEVHAHLVRFFSAVPKGSSDYEKAQFELGNLEFRRVDSVDRKEAGEAEIQQLLLKAQEHYARSGTLGLAQQTSVTSRLLGTPVSGNDSIALLTSALKTLLLQQSHQKVNFARVSDSLKSMAAEMDGVIASGRLLAFDFPGRQEQARQAAAANGPSGRGNLLPAVVSNGSAGPAH